MSVPLPPWLNVQPSDFSNAAATGAKLGLESAGISADLTKAAAEVDVRRQQIAAEQQRAAMEASVQAQAHQQQFEMGKAQMAIDHAEKQTNLGIQQAQLELDTKAAAQKFQQAQQYQQIFKQLTGSGVPDEEAAIKAMMAIGPTPGAGAELSALKRANRPTFVPGSVQSFPVMGQTETSPGELSQAPIPGMVAVPNPEGTGMEVRGTPSSARGMSETSRAMLGFRLQTRRDKLIESIPNLDVKEAVDSGSPPSKTWSDKQKALYNSAKKQVDSIDAQINKYTGETEAPASGAQSPAGGSSNDPLNLFSK